MKSFGDLANISGDHILNCNTHVIMSLVYDSPTLNECQLSTIVYDLFIGFTLLSRYSSGHMLMTLSSTQLSCSRTGHYCSGD